MFTDRDRKVATRQGLPRQEDFRHIKGVNYYEHEFPEMLCGCGCEEFHQIHVGSRFNLVITKVDVCKRPPRGSIVVGKIVQFKDFINGIGDCVSDGKIIRELPAEENKERSFVVQYLDTSHETEIYHSQIVFVNGD